MGGRYKTYSEYKDSGVEWLEEIPSSWNLVRAKNIFTIKKRIAGELGHDILSITQRGVKQKDIESGEGQLSMDYSKYQLVFAGDFAMNHMDLLTGYVDISKFNGVTSPDYRVFTIENTEDYDPEYYLYLLQNGYKQKLFFHLGQGSAHLGRWRLPTEAFNEIRYPKPTRKEQINIRRFLNDETAKIDTLIEEQQSLIQLLQEKRQAVISHAVTKGLNPDAPMKDSGVEWLGEVPEHWKVLPLKYVCKLIDGDRSSEYPNENDLVDSGIPFFSSKNIVNFRLTNKNLNFITPAKFDALGRGKLLHGDLIMTVRGTIGHVAIFDKKIAGHETGFINAQMMILRPKVDISNFLLRVSESDSWLGQLDVYSYGSTVKQLSNEVLGNTWIAFPPLSEVKKIDDFLNTICGKYEGLIDEAISTIQLMQERRTALISAAVTGKIDVREWSAPEPTSQQKQQTPEAAV